MASHTPGGLWAEECRCTRPGSQQLRVGEEWWHLPAGLCPTSRSAYGGTTWKVLEDEPLLQSSTVLQKPLFKVLVSVTVFGREIRKENNPAILHSFHYYHNLPSKAK